MPITQQDLRDFTDFAVAKLNNGGVESISELAAAWEDSRELDQSVERLRQSDADIEADRTKPLNEAFNSVRRDLRTRA